MRKFFSIIAVATALIAAPAAMAHPGHDDDTVIDRAVATANADMAYTMRDYGYDDSDIGTCARTASENTRVSVSRSAAVLTYTFSGTVPTKVSVWVDPQGERGRWITGAPQGNVYRVQLPSGAPTLVDTNWQYGATWNHIECGGNRDGASREIQPAARPGLQKVCKRDTTTGRIVGAYRVVTR